MNKVKLIAAFAVVAFAGAALAAPGGCMDGGAIAHHHHRHHHRHGWRMPPPPPPPPHWWTPPPPPLPPPPPPPRPRPRWQGRRLRLAADEPPAPGRVPAGGASIRWPATAVSPVAHCTVRTSAPRPGIHT